MILQTLTHEQTPTFTGVNCTCAILHILCVQFMTFYACAAQGLESLLFKCSDSQKLATALLRHFYSFFACFVADGSQLRFLHSLHESSFARSAQLPLCAAAYIPLYDCKHLAGFERRSKDQPILAGSCELH